MAQATTVIVFDYNVHIRNRNQWTLEQLAPYRDHWVAWSLDGKSIVAHHEDSAEVLRAVAELGLTGEDVLLGSLPSREELEGYS